MIALAMERDAAATEACPAPWIHQTTLVGRKCSACGQRVAPEAAKAAEGGLGEKKAR